MRVSWPVVMCHRHDDHGFPKFWISGKYHQLIQESEQLQGLVKQGLRMSSLPFAEVRYCFTVFSIYAHRLTALLKSPMKYRKSYGVQFEPVDMT